MNGDVYELIDGLSCDELFLLSEKGNLNTKKARSLINEKCYGY